jgi:hypothetical protein
MLRKLLGVVMLVFLLVTNSFAPIRSGISLSASSLIFAPQVVGTTSAAQTVTVTSTGRVGLAIHGIAGSGYYSQTNNCPGTLSPHFHCTITVTFAPTEIGEYNGVITITDNAFGSPHLVLLSGTGAAPVTFSPSSLSFGNITIGNTSSPQTVTLTNNQSNSLKITGITSSGDYTAMPSGIIPCTGTIAANGTCTFSVTFTPTIIGSIAGAVTVSTDASPGTQPVGLSGTGTGSVSSQVAISPTTLDFGNQEAGTTSNAKTVTVSNTSNSTTLSNITIVTPSSSPYQVSADTCTGATISARANCTFDVKFEPISDFAPITYPGAITVTDSDNTHTQIVGLSGSGVPPIIASPQNVDFGTVIQGQSSNPQVVTVTNNHTTSETLSIATAGNFSLDASNNTCTSSVAVAGKCSFQLIFNPRSLGNTTGAASVAPSSGGPLNPQVVNLSGCQTDISLTPTSLNFGIESTGTSSGLETATLLNGDANILNITSVSMGGTNKGEFAISKNACGASLDSGASCTIDLTFTPQATGSRNGTLTISDDGVCSAQHVNLIGGSSGPFTLTAATAGMGTGTVTSNPAGIDCGSNGSSCSSSYNTGTSVALTPTPDPSSDFGGWGERCTGTGSCALDMTADKQVTATFALGPVLNINFSGTGTGTVTSSPSGVTCSGVCATNFSTGTVVTLTAVADSGSTFTGWSGASCSGTGTCQVAMNTDQTVTANFTAQPDFSISGSAPNPVPAGQSAISTITVTSLNGFSGSVSLTCLVQTTVSLAPTCSLNPTSVTPATNGMVTSQLTMKTTGPSASLGLSSGQRLYYAFWLPLPGLVLAGIRFTGERSRKRRLAMILLLASLLVPGIIFQQACGGGGGGTTSNTQNPGTPAGSYTVTVNAMSGGSLQHSTQVTLTVQ